jgi:hypothetical protein
MEPTDRSAFGRRKFLAVAGGLLGAGALPLAQYRSDPHLQTAHAAFPWLVTWDDHEVENNFAGDISQDHVPRAAFRARRAAAYRAYWEHMPLPPGWGGRGLAMRADLKAGFDDPNSATVGTEFVGTSISLGLSATALEIVEPVEAGLAAHGVAFDGGGQFARDVQVLAGGTDTGGETAQRQFGRVEGAQEAEQPEDDERQSHRHQREDCAAAHRRLMTGIARTIRASSCRRRPPPSRCTGRVSPR